MIQAESVFSTQDFKSMRAQVLKRSLEHNMRYKHDSGYTKIKQCAIFRTSRRVKIPDLC